MISERLKDLHTARPFQSFTIHLADGRSVHVIHPEAMARRDNARMSVVLDPDDRAHHIDLLLVTELEVNGRSRRRKRS